LHCTHLYFTSHVDESFYNSDLAPYNHIFHIFQTYDLRDTNNLHFVCIQNVMCNCPRKILLLQYIPDKIVHKSNQFFFYLSFCWAPTNIFVQILFFITLLQICKKCKKTSFYLFYNLKFHIVTETLFLKATFWTKLCHNTWFFFDRNCHSLLIFVPIEYLFLLLRIRWMFFWFVLKFWELNAKQNNIIINTRAKLGTLIYIIFISMFYSINTQY
jgi:hypothetical protein